MKSSLPWNDSFIMVLEFLEIVKSSFTSLVSKLCNLSDVGLGEFFMERILRIKSCVCFEEMLGKMNNKILFSCP